jgi:PBP1b-binding outer membrane lipoprotein LpoB
MTKLMMMLLCLSFLATSCGSFKAKRVSSDEGDELAMSITDKWVDKDTENAVADLIKKIEAHKGFQKYLAKRSKKPKLFIADVQNETSEAYFPINNINDELLNQFSATGEFTLIDAQQRERLLKEIQYQNDGMVKPEDIKQIGKQSGADILIFGSVRMQPAARGGKTLKQYSINLRMTEIESSEEVLRVNTKAQKFSEQSATGW